jgi:hypothetical protein
MSPDDQPNATRFPLVVVFTSHWMAMAGLALVLTAIVLWSCLLTVELRHGEDNPYIGVGMAAVAAVFVLGLVLAPFGLYLGRRQLRQNIVDASADRKPAWRRFLVFLTATSLVNVLIASQLTMRAVHAMESRDFGASCHVMTPETRAFPQGAHAGILCVDCHVGEGARGFIEAKLGGTRQLISVLRNSVEMPIATAIASGRMVPSEETCEGCHWKRKPAAAKLKLIQRYAEDEANTPETTLLTMKIGGEEMGGIHGAHYAEGVEIDFVASDPARQEIPLVEYRNSKTGEQRTYVKTGANAAALANAPRIRMQCFDCHNRAAHTFQMPDRALDQALMLGRISSSLPFVKKAGLAILKTKYESSAAAAEKIPAALSAFYEKEQPEAFRARAAEILQAGSALAEIYSRNVFPELQVTWGTYPDNRGHQSAPGCLRCHAGEHKTASGEEITKNCFRCHYPAAVKDAKPEVLEALGLDQLLHELKR